MSGLSFGLGNNNRELGNFDSLYGFGQTRGQDSNLYNGLSNNIGLPNGVEYGQYDLSINPDNFSKFSSLAQGIGSLGQLWAGINQTNLAKKQFNFTRDLSNRNLESQAQSYNTQLEDRLRARNQSNAGEREAVNVENYMRDHRVNGKAI